LIRVLHPLQKRRQSRDGPTPPQCATPSAERVTPEDEDDDGEGERSDSGREEASAVPQQQEPSAEVTKVYLFLCNLT